MINFLLLSSHYNYITGMRRKCKPAEHYCWFFIDRTCDGVAIVVVVVVVVIIAGQCESTSSILGRGTEITGGR